MRLEPLTTYFLAETTQFKSLLHQKKGFENKSIHHIIQFRPTIVLYNDLSPLLVYFLECYDDLLATLKLLRLAGCFVSDMDYFHAVKQYQKKTNQLLSDLLVTSKNGLK